MVVKREFTCNARELSEPPIEGSFGFNPLTYARMVCNWDNTGGDCFASTIQVSTNLTSEAICAEWSGIICGAGGGSVTITERGDVVGAGSITVVTTTGVMVGATSGII